jgi:Zn-dependent M28 family amino/carboxypeptidase
MVPNKVVKGVNIVGMLPGRLTGTRDDRLILIGSHYDTMRTTSHGADDNGSGVVALLQVAKLLTSKSGK